MSKGLYRYRSAITGRYVSERYARRHPRTTVRERVR
jgi:hypothetical protein